jgi:type I restriction enzyme R subunit
MTVIRKKIIDKAFEIYLALYQGLTNYEGAASNHDADAYKQFSPGFFDLIVIDECHRGSASEDSAWRSILEYFKTATHIGLTATPKETDSVSNIEYFGEPIYTYSLKQGIDDGFLAPYKVIRVGLNVDLEGWRPDRFARDSNGDMIEDRIYNTKDYDRNLVIDERTKAVAHKVSTYLKKTNPHDKTIVFCIDIEHAARMRQALINENPAEATKSSKYVMRITGDDEIGKRELDNFINPEEIYPVIATTSKLMTTGVDAQTCKLIVLDSNIASMTEFKQIIGRGTRINEEYGKQFFTIMDFRGVTDLFADPDFDGDPVQIKVVNGDDDLTDSDDEYAVDSSDFPVDLAEPECSYIPTIIDAGEITDTKKGKIYVSGVDVSILNERIQHLDASGKLITESLKEYTKKGLLREFRSLDNFLTKWNNTEKKKTIIEELEAHNVILENLMEEVTKDKGSLANLDVFDLICHIAWDKPALSRRDRANAVKKRNYFTKYGGKAQEVLLALLDKYASEGIENIEELTILKTPPLDTFGTPQEILKAFGGRDEYLSALHELEAELYKAA